MRGRYTYRLRYQAIIGNVQASRCRHPHQLLVHVVVGDSEDVRLHKAKIWPDNKRMPGCVRAAGQAYYLAGVVYTTEKSNDSKNFVVKLPALKSSLSISAR